MRVAEAEGAPELSVCVRFPRVLRSNEISSLWYDNPPATKGARRARVARGKDGDVREVSDRRSVNATDRKLGERVRARRLEIGMTQEQLAKHIGVTFQQVQKYERGVSRIAASRLLDMAEAMKVPVATFFHGLGGKRGNRGAADGGDVSEPPGASELVRLYAALSSEKVRRRVLDLVRAMAETKD